MWECNEVTIFIKWFILEITFLWWCGEVKTSRLSLVKARGLLIQQLNLVSIHSQQRSYQMRLFLYNLYKIWIMKVLIFISVVLSHFIFRFASFISCNELQHVKTFMEKKVNYRFNFWWDYGCYSWSRWWWD